jgi:hypothetical protein
VEPAVAIASSRPTTNQQLARTRLWAGLIFPALLFYALIFVDNPTRLDYWILRIGLAVSGGVLGGSILGTATLKLASRIDSSVSVLLQRFGIKPFISGTFTGGFVVFAVVMFVVPIPAIDTARVYLQLRTKSNDDITGNFAFTYNVPNQGQFSGRGLDTEAEIKGLPLGIETIELLTFTHPGFVIDRDKDDNAERVNTFETLAGGI